MCALKTDAERVEWSRRYQMAMQRFLRQGTSGSLLPAARLGRRAVALGLETLDVARLHEQALGALASSAGSSGRTLDEVAEQTKVFFAETIVPIEVTHRAAKKASARIDRLTHTLQRRTKASSALAEKLERAIARRQAAEATTEESADRHDELLAEARRTQKRLQHQMRGALSEHEGERKRISGEIRDEVGQALIAIDLSLLALKTSRHINTENIKKNIADAHRLLGQLRTRGRK